MLGWFVAGLTILCAGWTLVLDLTNGATSASFMNGRGGQMIRRDEGPLIYFTLLGIKALAALLLVALVTGWFQTWILWSV